MDLDVGVLFIAFHQFNVKDRVCFEVKKDGFLMRVCHSAVRWPRPRKNERVRTRERERVSGGAEIKDNKTENSEREVESERQRTHLESRPLPIVV